MIIILISLENEPPEAEERLLPRTVDRDEFELEGPLPPICYYIVGGNELGLFHLNHATHELSVSYHRLEPFIPTK